MFIYLLVAIGGAFGSMARYGCSRWVALNYGETFPWGTLLVNIVGCFVIGFVGAISGPDSRIMVSPNVRNFIMVGFCGGYTTFSSFSLQTLQLIQNGDIAEAFGNVLLSVAACMAAVTIGYMAGMFVTGRMAGRF